MKITGSDQRSECKLGKTYSVRSRWSGRLGLGFELAIFVVVHVPVYQLLLNICYGCYGWVSLKSVSANSQCGYLTARVPHFVVQITTSFSLWWSNVRKATDNLELTNCIGVGTGGGGPGPPDFFVWGGPIWLWPPLLKNAAPSLS